MFGYTGEPTDANGLVQLRARYYNPALGVFTGLDPLEGGMEQPMALNRYMWVQGNVVNAVVPSGMLFEIPWDNCGAKLALAVPVKVTEPSFSIITAITAYGEPDYRAKPVLGTTWPSDWCDNRQNEIVRALKALYDRIRDMLKDECNEWYLAQGYAYLPSPDPKCYKTTWQTHIDSAMQRQRNVQRLYRGFIDQNCPDPNKEIGNTVNEWLAVKPNELMPEHEAARRGVPQSIPPQPNLQYACSWGIMIGDTCIHLKDVFQIFVIE